MTQFLNTGSLAALGWSLLNGIWQMGILWLGYLLLTRNNKRFSATARHNLAVFFSGLGFAWFLYSLLTELLHPEEITGWEPAGYFFSKASKLISPLLSAFTVVYLTILIFRTARHIFDFYQMRMKQMKRRGSEISFSMPLQLFSNRISPAMGIRRQISILLVDWVDTAQTVGFLKPLILLPVALLNQLSMQQAETILLHELLHIRRNDYLINILMTLFRTVFFFNPFARFFFRTVAEEREHACDDGVLQWDYPAPVYAEALFTLEKLRQKPHSFSLAANGNNPRLLMERIRRVVGSKPHSVKNPFSPLLFISMIAALFIFIVNSFSGSSRPDVNIQLRARVTAPIATSYAPAAGKAIRLVKPDNRIAETGKRTESVNKFSRSIRASRQSLSKAKYQKNPVIVTDPEILLDEDAAGVQIRFADHYVLRNYSNQKASEPGAPVIADPGETPYVPSASFSFQPGDDSLRLNVLLQNKWKALAEVEKIKTAELQVKIKEEISAKMKELNQMETQIEKKNRELIGQKQKDLQPALLKMKKDMLRKKKEIHRLRAQLQIQDGEIIFI